jgi:hypothetical protein
LTVRDNDPVSSGREQDESLEKTMTHWPTQFREKRLTGVVLGFNNNEAILIVLGRLQVASARHENASLIDVLGALASREIV